MKKVGFEEVWERILAHQGDTFHTKRNLAFTYKIQNGVLIPNRAKQLIGKSEFKKVYEIVPLVSLTPINKVVRGSSYVWAILHDKRISKGDW